MPLTTREKRRQKELNSYVTISQQLRQILIDDSRRNCELAKVLGVDRSQLSHFINGSKGLSLATLDKIAKTLRLSLSREEGTRGGKNDEA